MGTLLDIASVSGSLLVLYVSFVYILSYMSNRKRAYSDPKPPAELPKVTIVVPAKNEENTIEKTLKSILDLNYPKKLLQIIAVNDGSTDRTGEIIDSHKKFGIETIHKKNRGKASALNVGLKKATGEIFVCMDADSTVERNALMKTVGYFNDPEVGSVATSVKVSEPKNILQKVQFFEYIYNIFLRKVHSFMNAVFVVPGTFGLYKTSVLREIGGFDEGNLTEDMEIIMRMQDHGYRIETSSTTYSYTVSPDTWKKLFAQRTRWYQGFLSNSKTYKRMYFNPKYGDLGVFALPIYMVFIGFLFFFVVGTLYDFSYAIFHLFNVSLMSGLIKVPVIFQDPISVVGVFTILWALNIGFSVGISYHSYKMSREKFGIGTIFIFAFNLLFYGLFMALTWTTSIYRELRGEKTKWQK